MRIKSLQLKNFKRFTDLTLQDIPENAKLVLLIGSNGSGKSSVFDAFELASGKAIGFSSPQNQLIAADLTTDNLYYSKSGRSSEIEIDFSDNRSLKSYQSANKLWNYIGYRKENQFYGRSAIRYLPKLVKTTLGSGVNIATDTDRPKLYNEVDRRFENDIDLVMEDIVKRVFSRFNGKDVGQLDEVQIFKERINAALKNIFITIDENNLSLESITPPADGNPIQIIFSKGSSQFHYDLLSAGEKEVINLLFNFYTRSKVFNDTIYFIDEMDSHLNTSLQYHLLQEITENWIPDTCQLWTASHSLGFIDYANDNKNAVIIDFDDFDFDIPHILKPKEKNNFEVFEIAVGKAFIDKVIQGRKIIFSENTDTPLYNNLNIENVLFFVANDKTDVFHKAKNHRHFGIIDRDYLSDAEVEEITSVYPFLFILPYYSIENLLFHPENLEEYYQKNHSSFDIENYKMSLKQVRDIQKDYLLLGIVQARSGYPFYKENEYAKELKNFRERSREVVDLLRSDDFETFYKVFPAKDFGTTLTERQNVSKVDLAKTDWFRNEITQLIS